MQFFKQMLSSTLIVALLIPSTFAYAQVAPSQAEKQVSLLEVKKQAQKDMASFKKIHGQNTPKALAAVLAFFPVFSLKTYPLRELGLYLEELQDRLAYTEEFKAQYKDLLTFYRFLNDQKYGDAAKLFEKIDETTWKNFTSSSYLRKDLDKHFAKLLKDAHNYSTIRPLVFEVKIPARDFYVINQSHLTVRTTGISLPTIYNDIRDILIFIERDTATPTYLTLDAIEQVYGSTSWWKSVPNMSRIMSTIIYKKDLLYKHPEKLIKYVEKLETMPMPLKIRRALQTNLLARTNNLQFYVQETLTSKTLVVHSKLTKVKTNSHLLSNWRWALSLAVIMGLFAVTAPTQASAQDTALLNRLQNNIDLFLSASDDQLNYIEQNELSEQYCRQAAQSLHEALVEPSLIPVALQFLEDAQTEQTATKTRNDIIRNFQQIGKAH